MTLEELLRRLMDGDRFKVTPQPDGSFDVSERPRATLEAVVIKADGTRVELGEVWSSDEKEK